jgi:hypothetical protein
VRSNAAGRSNGDGEQMRAGSKRGHWEAWLASERGGGEARPGKCATAEKKRPRGEVNGQ